MIFQMIIKKSQLQIILTLLLSILIMTCLNLTGFAYETQPINAVPFISEYASEMQVFGGSIATVSLPVQTDFKVTGNFSVSTSNISFGFRSDSEYAFEYPFNYDAYDYYVALTVWSTDGARGVVGFVPSNMYVYTSNEGTQVSARCTDFSFNHHDSGNMQGFTAIGKIPETYRNSTIRFIGVGGRSAGLTGEINFRAFIYQVSKSAGCDHSDVIAAINNQTQAINNNHVALIQMLQEGFNTLDNSIQNGNPDTSDIIQDSENYKSDFDTLSDDFTDYTNSIIYFEDKYKDDFDGYSQQIQGVMDDYSVGGSLLQTSYWVSDRMTDVFNSSGVFKIVFMFPLILGIALSLF